VHPRTRLGDHALLAHAPGHEGLAHGVVHLVSAGVVQVLALEVDLRAAGFFREALAVVDRAGAPDVMLELIGELALELGVFAALRVRERELVERRAQRLRDEHAAVRAEVALRVRQRIAGPLRRIALHLHVARSE
jgi:hypothetical protein